MMEQTDSRIELTPRPVMARPITVEVLMGMALLMVLAVSVYLVWFEKVSI